MVALCSSLLLLLSGCWLQPGFDAGGTRWNWVEDELTVANVASLTEVWSVDLPWRPSEPLGVGDRVFVGSRGGSSSVVRAIDTATGETVWEQTVSPEDEDVATHLPATFIEGELWSDYWLPSEECSEPSGSGFDPRGVGVTVRLDPDDGTIVASDRSRLPIGRPIQSGNYVVQRSVPHDANGCAYILSGRPTLSVHDSRTLQTLWTAESGHSGRTMASGDLLLTGRRAWTLKGCGAPTCDPIWDFSGTGSLMGAGPDTPVFYWSRAGWSWINLYAVSRATGEIEWSAGFDGSNEGFAIDDDHIYIASNGTNPALHAYDVDGCGSTTCSPVWSASVSSDIGFATEPTVAGDVVYVAGWDGAIHAYSAQGCGSGTCTELATIETGAADGGPVSMSVSGGRLFVTSRSEDGTYTLKAFAPTT